MSWIHWSNIHERSTFVILINLTRWQFIHEYVAKDTIAHYFSVLGKAA